MKRGRGPKRPSPRTGTDMEPAKDVKDTKHRAGKYLTFILAGEAYGLEILRVREIIAMLDITPVPRTPAFVKGVINLRGKVIPVIDLRMKFCFPGAAASGETCIIVVDIRGAELGIMVDKVSEVLSIAESDIDDTPSFGASVDTGFILGIGKTGGGVTILLDIARVLADMETPHVVAA